MKHVSLAMDLFSAGAIFGRIVMMNTAASEALVLDRAQHQLRRRIEKNRDWLVGTVVVMLTVMLIGAQLRVLCRNDSVIVGWMIAFLQRLSHTNDWHQHDTTQFLMTLCCLSLLAFDVKTHLMRLYSCGLASQCDTCVFTAGEASAPMEVFMLAINMATALLMCVIARDRSRVASTQ